jgi:hypothetical protein
MIICKVVYAITNKDASKGHKTRTCTVLHHIRQDIEVAANQGPYCHPQSLEPALQHAGPYEFPALVEHPDHVDAPGDALAEAACSLGLSATSQQYFSLRTNQPPATSHNQPAVLFSQNKPAPAISHQPTEQAAGRCPEIGT